MSQRCRAVWSEDKKNNQTHVTLFQKQFGVSDLLKQTPTTKMIFYGVPIASIAHSNFLYTFYEQTKSLGDAIFAVRTSGHSEVAFSSDEEMKKNALQKQLQLAARKQVAEVS